MADESGGQAVSGELRNVRYCEVIPVTRKGLTLTSWVYNTLGLNDCPQSEWDALTEDEVNEAYGSVSAKLNGPRYWVIDGLAASGSTTSGQTFAFGGIEMALRATLDTKAGQATVGDDRQPRGFSRMECRVREIVESTLTGSRGCRSRLTRNRGR